MLAAKLSGHSGSILTNKSALLGGLLLLCAFAVQGIFFIRANSQTVDEATHLAAGYSYLATGDFRLDREHPPLIKELQALPLFLAYRMPFIPDPQQWLNEDGFVIGHDFLYKSPLDADRILTPARMVTLLLGGCLLAAIGLWAYRLWGRGAALLAMSIASFEPTLIAHSSLVTTDLGVTLFGFLAVYLLWEYVRSPTWAGLAMTGICTGMALVSKYSALLLIPILLSIVAFLCVCGRPLLLPVNQVSQPSRHRFLQMVAALLFMASFAFLIIPVTYFFEGFTTWISGLKLLLKIVDEGRVSFFLGKYSEDGWWNYFLTAFLIKTPIGTLALIAASLVLYRAGHALKWPEATFLLVPVILFFAVTTQSNMAIGVRHILPVYPFLFVLAGRLATVQFRSRGLASLLVGSAVLWTGISSIRTAPHQLAYFNEIVGGPDQGYRYLSDSNLDWGQDLKGVKAYMEQEKLPIIYLSYFGTASPSYYGIHYQYVPGTGTLEWPPPTDQVPANAARKIFAISVYNLQDVSHPSNPLFQWLEFRKPIAKIGYSIFVYDLTEDREGLANLEETYVKAGIGMITDLSLGCR